MSRPTDYRQCLLQKKVENSILQQFSWIPTAYASQGAVLKLKQADGTWDDGWVVSWAGEPHPGRLVERFSRDYLRHREEDRR